MRLSYSCVKWSVFSSLFARLTWSCWTIGKVPLLETLSTPFTPGKWPGLVAFSEGHSQRALVGTYQLQLNGFELLSCCQCRYWNWSLAWLGSWVSDVPSTCCGVQFSRPAFWFVSVSPFVIRRQSLFPASSFALFIFFPSHGSGLQLSWPFLECALCCESMFWLRTV